MHGAPAARASQPRDGRPKRERSVYADVDLWDWLDERGRRMDRSIDWQIREILREKRDAEQAEAGGTGRPAGRVPA